MMLKTSKSKYLISFLHSNENMHSELQWSLLKYCGDLITGYCFSKQKK